jgi:hypothetical protein
VLHAGELGFEKRVHGAVMFMNRRLMSSEPRVCDWQPVFNAPVMKE